jgi:hypothetical protein
MSEHSTEREVQVPLPHHSEPSPLTMPPARLREQSADDLEIDVSDSRIDLPLDDSDRLREDAETLRD